MSQPTDKLTTPKICFVLPSLVTAGAELQAIEQINELAKRGVEVCLVILSTTVEEPLIDKLSLPSERILRLDNQHVTLRAAALPSLRGFGKVGQFLKSNGCEYCIAILPFSQFFMRLTKLRYLGLRTKLIAYHHSLQYFASPLNTVGKKIFNRFNATLAYFTDNQHWFISAASRDDVQRHFFTRDVKIIPNAKNFDGITDHDAANELLAQFDINDDDFCILFPGRLHPTKGHVACMESFERFLAAPENQPIKKRIKMLIVGYGVTEPDVRDFIQQRGLEKQLKMFGRIENQTLMALYQKCQITLVPSISEGFGLVAIEAMVNRSVVIASDAGGLKNLVDHGKNGYQFPIADYDRMNELLEFVIANYPQLEFDLDHVSDTTRTNFSMQSQVDHILKLL